MNKSTRRAQTPPRPKCRLKVIRDSNPDFQINPDWMSTRSLPIWRGFTALLVSVTLPSFVQISQWLRNGKCPKIVKNRKVIYQKLIISRGSPLAHVYHVWSTSVTTFVSYPAHRQQTERTITLLRQPWWSKSKATVEKTTQGKLIHMYNTLHITLAVFTSRPSVNQS